MSDCIEGRVPLSQQNDKNIPSQIGQNLQAPSTTLCNMSREAQGPPPPPWQTRPPPPWQTQPPPP